MEADSGYMKALKEGLDGVKVRVDAAIAKRDADFSELTARVRDAEQKLARRGGDGGGGNDGGGARARLSDAAEGIIEGLKGSTSARLELPMSIRASLSSDAPGAGGTEQYAVPTQDLGPVSVYPAVARLLGLLPDTKVTGNSATYIRIGYGANSPDNLRAEKVPELGLKPESGVDTVPVLVELPTWAHYFKVSKQILDDVGELRTVLDTLLRNGLLDKVDAGIYADLTTSGNYTAFTPGSGETDGDGVARAAAQVVNAGGSNVIVAVNPTTYLGMQLAKASTAGTYLGLPPTMAARLVAIPTVAAGKVLAFSPGDGAGWLDREGINVVFGYADDDFIRNAIRIRAELRGATAVRNPALVAYGDIT
ncbi:MAG: hypothetical protein ABI624_10080 [Casimicrobiaceae bacterium]